MSSTTTNTRLPRVDETSRRWWSHGSAAVASAVALAFGLVAWHDPAVGLLSSTDGVLVGSVASPTGIAILVTLAAASGLAGLIAARMRPLARPRIWLCILAALQVAVFGLALGSVTAIALAGYLVALAMPVLLFVVLVQAMRRYQRARWIAAVLAAAFVAWGLASGTLWPDSLRALATQLVSGFASAGLQLVGTVATTAVTVTWALVLAQALRGTPLQSRTGAYVLRHRRLWTGIAAVCALPYGVLRMTWFTPWPLLAPGEDLTSETRLWGLLLGSGSLLGFVLTLGLIRPWGERFPRWMPVLAGRPVPVAAAVVPGGLVAAVICSSALPMLQTMTFTTGGAALGVTTWAIRVAFAFVFPFWLWGPTLALAVWGYVLHRRGVPTSASLTR